MNIHNIAHSYWFLVQEWPLGSPPVVLACSDQVPGSFDISREGQIGDISGVVSGLGLVWHDFIALSRTRLCFVNGDGSQPWDQVRQTLSLRHLWWSSASRCNAWIRSWLAPNWSHWTQLDLAWLGTTRLWMENAQVQKLFRKKLPHCNGPRKLQLKLNTRDS